MEDNTKIFAELKSIANDAITANQTFAAGIPTMLNSLTDILMRNSDKVDVFYEHEKNWSKKSNDSKVQIIMTNIMTLDIDDRLLLAEHFYIWFKWIFEEPVRCTNVAIYNTFSQNYTNTDSFLKFVEILDYNQLRRCLEECVADEYPLDLIIKLMQDK